MKFYNIDNKNKYHHFGTKVAEKNPSIPLE
jgi:hypothetical protein